MSIDSTGYVTGTNMQQQRNEELKKACREFESVFTYELLKSMRKTIDKCDLFHGGEGEEIYESLLDQELAKSMSGYGSNSLSGLLYQQLSRMDSSSQANQGDYSGTQSEPRALTGYSYIAPKYASYKNIGTQVEWPLKAVISSKFGWRKDPFTSENKFHSGVDLAAENGTEINAALSGKVIMSCKMEDYGNVVAVDHGHGIVTLYAHNEKNLVKVGDEVRKGSPIALVGSTGRSTGPHLHFEVRKDGIKIDPLKFMGVA